MKKKINMQFIIVSFIAIILTMSLSVGTFYELFVQEMRNDMKAYTHVLRSAGVFNASNEEKLNLKNEDLRITIIDADGTVVYDNEANDIEMDNHKDRPEIESALKNGEGSDVRKSSTLNKSTYYYAVLLDDGQVLRIAKEASSVWNIFIKVLPLILGIIILMLFSVGIITHYITKSIVKPVEELANNIDEIKDKRIAVLLSGGVDSSVVVWEFAQLGLHPDCFYIKIGPEEKEEWDCSSEEDLEMATAVARKYGCKLHVVDCHHEYWNEVTRYTMEKVKAGFTPNPDVMCNRLIKFGAFDEKMGHNYDLIATGHYAQTETDENGDKWLVTSPDPVKDQTDFLAQIESWQLKKAIFPIGHHIKNEVREIAEEEHLINAKRKDSQGICFLGQINYNDYIRRYLGEKPGDVIEMETGKRIGEHKGLWFHTIGQRKGLGFGGGPWFVIKKDVENNILYVSHGYDPQSAYKKDFPLHDFHFLTREVAMQKVTFKIRHTPEYHPATIEKLEDGRWMIHSEEAIHGVAPGQFCVVYDEHHHRCYGSGEITV